MSLLVSLKYGAVTDNGVEMLRKNFGDVEISLEIHFLKEETR